MMQAFFLKQKIWDMFAIFSCIIFIIAGTLVSVNRFWQYEVFYIDFGIFDQAIWSVSRFQPPIIDHFIVSGKWNFADHFNPSIFLLSPLYWFTNRSEMLLIVQSIAAGLSGFFLYRIGVEVTKVKFFSFAILLSYFFFIGLQNAVISEFHELTVMTLPLMLIFWSIAKRKLWLYFVCLVIVLGFKEVMFSLGIALGLTIFFLVPQWRKIAILTIAISLLWGFLTIHFIIPWFSDGIYIYTPTIPPTLKDKAIFLFDHPTKRSTLLYSFWSFGFLPVFSPPHWILILQDYAARFSSPGCCTRWDLGLHYNSVSAVILGVSSLFGFNHLKKIKIFRHYSYLLSIFLILNAFFLYRFFFHGPLGLALNPVFYEHTKDFSFLNTMIQKIPKDAVVMTHNSLAARFTHQKVWLLRENYQDYKPDYVLIDLREGQNPNDFFTTRNPDKILKKLLADKHYQVIYKTKEQFIFKLIKKENSL